MSRVFILSTVLRYLTPYTVWSFYTWPSFNLSNQDSQTFNVKISFTYRFKVLIKWHLFLTKLTYLCNPSHTCRGYEGDIPQNKVWKIPNVLSIRHGLSEGYHGLSDGYNDNTGSESRFVDCEGRRFEHRLRRFLL